MEEGLLLDKDSIKYKENTKQSHVSTMKALIWPCSVVLILFQLIKTIFDSIFA